MDKKKVFVTTSFRNCQMNNYLTARISQFAGLNDCDVVDSPEKSDYIVVTTCGFDQPREDHSRSMITQLAQDFPDKKVVVSGCLPGIAPEFHQGLGNVIPINTDQLHGFDSLFDAKIQIKTVKPNVISDVPAHGPQGLFNIEISTGCTNRCTFCVIWKTKGRLTSKPIDDIVAEIEDGIRRGYDRFCFLSDNVALYGIDRRIDLADLLNRVAEIEGDFKVMLYYAHPRQFAPLFPKISPAAMSKVCYLDLPFQSGSAELLKAMKREYAPEDVVQLARQIKAEYPEIVLSTQFIVGFPGETMDDFFATLDVAQYFDQATFFPYSDRAGTAAVGLPAHVASEELEARKQILAQFIKGNPRMQIMETETGSQPDPEVPMPMAGRFVNGKLMIQTGIRPTVGN
jgi:tRNA-2-methylthio-N6-dimethylallyladenosine synthase